MWCLCPPEFAHARFMSRERHPGHFDAELVPNLNLVPSGPSRRVSVTWLTSQRRHPSTSRRPLPQCRNSSEARRGGWPAWPRSGMAPQAETR